MDRRHLIAALAAATVFGSALADGYPNKVVRLQVPVETVKPGSHPVHFEVDGQDSNAVVVEKTVFIVPR